MKRSIPCTPLVILLLVCGCKNEAQEACKRGYLANEKHDYDLAISEYTEAIRLNPNCDAEASAMNSAVH